jgi:enoyl-CoA hydratase
MSYQFISVENSEAICLITINRPEQMNALNQQTIQELHEAFKVASGNHEVRAIVLTGSGEKSFVAGADIKEFASFNSEQGKNLSASGHNLLFNYVENLEKPVIAAVNGYAFGGGLELAMSCHIRIASENAIMGLPEVSLGVIPGYGGTQRLTRLVGRGKATELIVSAGRLNASEALECGLVNSVFPLESLKEKAMELANKIAKQSPTAIAAALRAIRAGFEFEKIGLEAEISEFGNCFETQDFKEGTSAFLEKRKPNFKGL